MERRNKWVHTTSMKELEFGRCSLLYPHLLEDEKTFFGSFKISIEKFYRL